MYLTRKAKTKTSDLNNIALNKIRNEKVKIKMIFNIILVKSET